MRFLSAFFVPCWTKNPTNTKFSPKYLQCAWKLQLLVSERTCGTVNSYLGYSVQKMSEYVLHMLSFFIFGHSVTSIELTTLCCVSSPLCLADTWYSTCCKHRIEMNRSAPFFFFCSHCEDVLRSKFSSRGCMYVLFTKLVQSHSLQVLTQTILAELWKKLEMQEMGQNTWGKVKTLF